MKKTTNLTATALAVAVATGAGFATPQAAQAEVSYNIGIHSKYLLRGIFEENSGTAIQGGADWSSENSGLYAGYWFSSLGYTYEAPADTKTDESGFENDFYIGYAGDIGGGFGYDVGLIQYVYVNVDDSDLTEAVASLSFSDFYVKAQYLLSDGWWGNSGDIYWTAGWSGGIGGGVTLALDYGYYTYDDDDAGNPELGAPTLSTSGFRHFNVTASKEVMKDVEAYLQYTFAGEDRTGAEYNDSMVAGVTYSF